LFDTNKTGSWFLTSISNELDLASPVLDVPADFGDDLLRIVFVADSFHTNATKCRTIGRWLSHTAVSHENREVRLLILMRA
jgi:hypothetical protein